jgi:hypothetical protein
VFLKNKRLTFSVMMRFTSILLLIPYCLVSLMGHAGFDAVGFHSHGHSECEHTVCLNGGEEDHEHSCEHMSDGLRLIQGTNDHSQNKTDGQNECPDDCTVCQFFSLLNAQVTAFAVPCVTSFSITYANVFADQDTLVAFCLTRRQRPRAPPVSIA